MCTASAAPAERAKDGKAFTFVTARDHFKLRDIIRCTKAHITQGRLPTLQDVDTIRMARLLEEVRKTIQEDPLERWLTALENFVSEYFPEGEIASRDIAGALLKLLAQKTFGTQNNAAGEDVFAVAPRSAGPGQTGTPGDRESKNKLRQQRGPRNTGPMVTLQLNVGRAHKVTPGQMVGAIAGECGIPSSQIGAIGIRQLFSLVDIAADVADQVLDVLQRGVFICGVRVTAKVDAGKGGSAPARKFFAGTRRQHSGKFGKKTLR